MIEFIFSISFATDLPGEDLFVAEKKSVVEQPLENKIKTRPKKVKSSNHDQVTEAGNLPNYFNSKNEIENPTSELVLKPAGSIDIFRGLNVGDSVNANIDHSIIAFRDEKSPVVAEISTSGHRGVRLIGSSRLEPNSRRVFVSFDRLVVGGRIFNISAVGVSASGQPGLEGKYYSREGEYFAGDFISSFVAGYFDGLVPRKTNVFGQSEPDTSVDSAVKKGLASGALSSAERFREKLKRSPEFSEIQGPLEIKIMVLDHGKKE